MIIPSSKHEVTSENASVRLLCSFSRCCQPSCCPPMTSKRGFTFCTLSKGIWNLARNIRRIVPQKCQLIIKQGCTCSLLASCSQKRMRMIGTGINFIKHIRKPEGNCRDLPGEFLYYRHGPCCVGGHDAFKPTQPFGRKTCMGISNLQNGWVSKLLCFGGHEPPLQKKQDEFFSVFKVKAYMASSMCAKVARHPDCAVSRTCTHWRKANPTLTINLTVVAPCVQKEDKNGCIILTKCAPSKTALIPTPWQQKEKKACTAAAMLDPPK